MQKIFLISLVALGLGISSASFSQETKQETTEQPTPETTATETATTEPKADEAATSEPNSEDQTFPVAKDPENQIGVEYLKEAHGAWKIICIRAAEGKTENCRMYQLLKDDTDSAVAEISILKLEKAAQAAAGVNFITPLGTLLTAQASMRIDSGKVKRYPYNWCEKQGCITRFGLTVAELDNLKKGSKAVMSITAVAAPKAPLSLDLSLTGFTAAWKALNTE